MEPNEPHDQEDAMLFVPIADEPGPALPFSNAEADAVARAVVRRVQRRAPPLRQVLQAAAGVVVALAVAGAAAAAVTTYLSRAESTRGTAPEGKSEVAPSARRVPRPAPSEAPPPPAIAPTTAPAMPEPSVTPSRTRDLLREANRLRGAGSYRQAERLYTEISRSTADADAAYAARIAAASLRLEQLANPRGALALYRESLRSRSSGPLSEEARYGVAQCHRALGDARGEARALRALLEVHPRTLLREQAEARLRALGSDADDRP
jgi:tetratricopeptide (TPR) repeat protein